MSLPNPLFPYHSKMPSICAFSAPFNFLIHLQNRLPPQVRRSTPLSGSMTLAIPLR
jgi:hypothetical protein